MKRYDVYCECETATDTELSPDGEWVKAEVAKDLYYCLIHARDMLADNGYSYDCDVMRRYGKALENAE